MSKLKSIYKRRFGDDVSYRNALYGVLCSNFFSKFIPKNKSVVEMAAGYCEFINNIQAREKTAIDLNPDVKKYAAKGVKVRIADATKLKSVPLNSADVVYISNFFEHISKDDILKVLSGAHRMLKKGGRIMVLQPNIRYCYKNYWMFFDHITPLDDRSLCEALEISGFKVIKCIPKFLPFSIKSRLPKALFLVKIYLNIPLLQRMFGKQAFVVAKKV